MKASLLALSAPILLAAIAVACAASETEAQAPSPDADAGTTSIPEGGAADGAADVEPDVPSGIPACSEAGWCVTDLPDSDLVMRAIWPVADRAFALAQSPTLGVKVLEWSEADGTWTYIDDGTQNEFGVGAYVGNIWAPNEDEVHYAVAPGYVYHGRRPAKPLEAWSWSRHKLPDNSHPNPVTHDDGYPSYWALTVSGMTNYPTLGVWGTSADDVYAWFANTIFHFTVADGGAPEWVAEHIADDVDAASEHLYILGAAGKSRDEIWFSGARSRTRAGCALLIRKTAEGYRRIADGVVSLPNRPCAARAGTMMIGGTEGWLTDIQALDTGEIVALKGGRDTVRIVSNGDDHSVALARVPDGVLGSLGSSGLTSLWATGNTVWLSGNSIVVRGTDVWGAGGYQVSTVSRTGGSLDHPLYRIRGTSNNNLWAIGVRHALHKKTP